jgi:gag-polypeptide of LTR copia-type
MIMKLNERYASSTLSTRMSLISKLYTLSYIRNNDMGEYLDTYKSLLNRLEAMNAPIPGALAVIMFLSSLQGHFETTFAAIRFLSNDDLTLDDATSRLIEEASSPRSRTRQDSAFVVNSRPTCTFCGRQGHDANRCFKNPANPSNLLGNSTLQPSSQRSGPNRRSAMVHSVDPKAPAFPPPAVPEDIPVPHATAFATERPPQRESRGRGPRAYQLLIAHTPPTILPDVSSSLASPILIDYEASAHMCPHREWFTDILPCAPCHILLGDDLTIVCKEEGTIHFTVHSDTRPYTFLLPNALYTPALCYTLISCSALSFSALYTYFAVSSCSINNVSAPSSPVLVTHCTHRDGLYFLSTPAEALSSTHIPFPDPATSSAPALHGGLHSRASSPTQDMDTRHRRLGNTGTHKIRSMLRTGQLPPTQNTIPCNECILGKQHRHPFHGSIATATRTIDVIHSDVVGLLRPSHSGSCYLVTFVDEFTRYATIFALIRKISCTGLFQSLSS